MPDRTLAENERLLMHRVWAMPSRDTFDVAPIGAFVCRYLARSRVSIDPYARNKRWATYTNDLNPQTRAEYHLDAIAFLELLAEQDIVADLAIIDPPYSPRQVKECYDGIGLHMGRDDALLGLQRAKLRRALLRVLTPDATVLWCGWNSVGMGRSTGFELREVLLVCHGSDHNDTICTAECRIVPMRTD